MSGIKSWKTCCVLGLDCTHGYHQLICGRCFWSSFTIAQHKTTNKDLLGPLFMVFILLILKPRLTISWTSSFMRLQLYHRKRHVLAMLFIITNHSILYLFHGRPEKKHAYNNVSCKKIEWSSSTCTCYLWQSFYSHFIFTWIINLIKICVNCNFVFIRQAYFENVLMHITDTHPKDNF